VGGGVLAARLASQVSGQSGRVLGLYYGGTGLGIVLSSLLVAGLDAGRAGGAWGTAWALLGACSLLASGLTAWGTRALKAPPALGAARARLNLGPFAFGLLGYALFGLGYIGYMTFIVTLLREQQLSTGAVVAFYIVLGLGVIASPWLWAGLLQRQRGGGALARLSALLAVATALPVLWPNALVAFASGALFGGVFLSVVASTTALVRHNLPTAAWPAGISAFTIVFAFGQIVGPSLVGRLADGSGGLRAGLLVSAGALLLGALLATRQKPLN
jgi:hypothetical protein